MSPLSFFKCLAEDTRLKIMLLLCRHHELCVCDLQDALALSQPKVSRHLAELRKCKLLSTEKRGHWVYYKLHDDLPLWAINVLRDTLKENSAYMQDTVERFD